MKRFAVIGLGKFGFQVAKTLYEEGHEVIAIDNDKGRVQAIGDHCTEAVLLDAKDKERLLPLGLETMDSVVVSTGTRVSTSIMISLYLKEMGVERILVKALDEDHAKILLRVGATEIIQPEKEMAIKVAKGLSTPNILDFIPLEEDYSMVQIAAPSPLVGKSLKETELRARYNVYVIGIKRKEPKSFNLAPSADATIRSEDTLVLLGKTEDIRRIKGLH